VRRLYLLALWVYFCMMWLAILIGVGLALGVLLLGNYLATRATLRPPRTPFFYDSTRFGAALPKCGVPLARRRALARLVDSRTEASGDCYLVSWLPNEPL
jgi:hypothetical protein